MCVCDRILTLDDINEGEEGGKKRKMKNIDYYDDKNRGERGKKERDSFSRCSCVCLLIESLMSKKRGARKLEHLEMSSIIDLCLDRRDLFMAEIFLQNLSNRSSHFLRG